MLGPRVGVPARTVSRILRRHRVRYLRVLDPMTGEAIRSSKTTAVRYKRDRPGELVHMDQVTRSIALVAADQFSIGPALRAPWRPGSREGHRSPPDPTGADDAGSRSAGPCAATCGDADDAEHSSGPAFPP